MKQILVDGKMVDYVDARQGDVIITYSDEVADSSFKQQSSGVIAEGKVTGHAHRIGEPLLFRDDGGSGRSFILPKKAAPMTHEQHRDIVIPCGVKVTTRIKRQAGKNGWEPVHD